MRNSVFWMIALVLGAGCGAGSDDSTAEGEIGQAVVANDKLILHFDEASGATVFDDTSAANLSPTCAGAACPATGGIGLLGTPNHGSLRRAADFDGVSDCLTIADTPQLEMSVPLTISAWILPRALPAANGGMTVLSKYNSSGNQREWIFGIRADASGTSRLSFWKSSDGASGTTAAYDSVRTLGAADLNKWMHVLFRANASGAYQFWVNGVQNASGTFSTTAFFAGASSARVGCVERSTTAPDMFFKGKLDEILVAKSYISDADLQSQYTWSRPAAPSVAFAAGAPTDAVTGVIDDAALAARITNLNTDLYRFFIRRDKLCNGVSCLDLNALRTFLTNHPSIDVIIERNPLWYTIAPAGAGATCTSKATPASAWGCAIGEIARSHPNLVGWSIDDFFAEKDDSSLPAHRDSFLDRTNALAACNAAHDATTGDPGLKIYATIYCNYPMPTDPAIVTKYHMGDWWQGAATSPTHELGFRDYVGSNATLRSCLSGVSLYTAPAQLTNGAATINACIDALRPLQGTGPGLEIMEGVYITDLSNAPIDCATRNANVAASRGTFADGLSFFVMPDAPPASSCPSYASLQSLAASPGSYIQW